MPGTAWAHVLSLELSWMTPGEARAFIARAVDAGHLIDDDGLRLAVDPKSVDIPRGFRPDPNANFVETATPMDPFLGWVDRLADGGPREPVLEQIATKQDGAGGLLDATTAALCIASERGLDVRAAAAEALTILQAESVQ